MRLHSIDLRLSLSYREKTFEGHATYEVVDAGSDLTLESEGLEIERATVEGVPCTFAVDRASSTLTILGLPSGTRRLELWYRGAASADSLVGLYVSPTGTGYCLTSMMFPSGARRLVPCLEHPSVKTVFRVTLTTEQDVVVLFNTAARSERIVGDRREIAFDPTPPMSSYLLYLAVGHFDTLVVPGSRWSVTVATSPGRASLGQYAADRAPEILAEYERYYGVPYPLGKLDLVGLENFWAGAMENWGAIAFRESLLLLDPTSSALDRQVVLRVLAHEIAHQWFGNLVTPAEWSDFWLNESFATFVGHRSIALLYPKEDPWTAFMNANARIALEQDALESTHPIHVLVKGADGVNEITDEITYGKGAYVLRMIESYLGAETFRRGVSRYLERHKFGNAHASDLWEALSTASGRPVDRIMHDWITHTGYPLIRVRWTGRALELRQERYRQDGRSNSEVWPIPLTVRSKSQDQSFLFDTSQTELPLADSSFVLVDPGRSVFARVFYEGDLFSQLISRFPDLPPIDQWGLVNDTSAFVVAGLCSLPQLLDLVEAASSVRGDLPVRAVTEALSELYVPLHDHPQFLGTARGYLREQLEFLGRDPAPGEPESARVLREVLSACLVRMDPDFAREMAPRFHQLEDQPPELRGTILKAFVRSEGARAFDPMLRRLRATPSDNERALVLQALGLFQEPDALREALELIPSPGVTPAGAMELFVEAVANPAAGATLFDWYDAHAAELARMWAGTPLLGSLLRRSAVVMGLDRESWLSTYFQGHTPPTAERSVKEGLLALHALQGLRDRNRWGGPPSSARLPGGP